LRALAVTAAKRIAALPDVPTMAEAGVPDQEADTLTGMVAPAGTPAAIIAKLNGETKKAVEQKEVLDKLTVLGFVPVLNTPDEFSDRIKREIEKWGKVVHDAHIRIE
jgi:tripartite-type tricarboxylate transporter receptor subunit TctC